MDAETYYSIKKDEYDELQFNSALLKILVNALKNAARLNYSADGLYFDDSKVDNAFRMLLPCTYQEFLLTLQEEKQNKEGNANDETL